MLMANTKIDIFERRLCIPPAMKKERTTLTLYKFVRFYSLLFIALQLSPVPFYDLSKTLMHRIQFELLKVTRNGENVSISESFALCR